MGDFGVGFVFGVLVGVMLVFAAGIEAMMRRR